MPGVYDMNMTSLDPAGQDYQRLYDQYAASKLAFINDKLQNEQVMGMARIGAERLRALGPEGAQWADNLLADPYGTMAAAQQFGGMEQIENELMYRAQQQRNLDPQALGQEMVGIYGAKDAAAFIAAQAKMREAQAGGGEDWVVQKSGDGYLYRVNKVTGETEQLPGQGAPISDGSDEGDFTFGNALTLASQNANTLKDFTVQRQFYDQAVAATQVAIKFGPEAQGDADFALVSAYGKMLDPNSTVRESEAGFIITNTSSDVSDIFNRTMRFLSPQGALNPVARLKLMRQIDALYSSQTTRQLQLMQEMRDKVAMASPDPSKQAMALPPGMGVSEMKFDFDFYDKLRQEFEAKKGPLGSGERAPAAPEGKKEWEEGGVKYRRSRGRVFRWDEGSKRWKQS